MIELCFALSVKVANSSWCGMDGWMADSKLRVVVGDDTDGDEPDQSSSIQRSKARLLYN